MTWRAVFGRPHPEEVTATAAASPPAREFPKPSLENTVSSAGTPASHALIADPVTYGPAENA